MRSGTGNKRSGRWLRITLAAIAVLAVLIVGTNMFLGRKIRTALEEKVNGSGKELYSLSIDDCNVNVLTGTIKLQHVKLMPKQGSCGSETLLVIYVPSIKMSGIGLWRAYKGEQFIFSDLEITRPYVSLCRKKTEAAKQSPVELHQLVAARFKEVIADNISIKDASLRYRVFKNGRTAEHLSVDLSIGINDVLINAGAKKDTSRSYYSKNIDVNISKYAWSLADSNYTILASGINLSGTQKHLTIDSIYFSPNYTRTDLLVKQGENGYMQALLRGVELKNINSKALLEQKTISASLLHVRGGRLFVHKNKQLPEKEKEQKVMPQQGLRELDVKLDIDSTLLNNIAIKYQEISPVGMGPGLLTLERINASIGKLCNSPEYLASNPVCEMKISAEIMGRGKLDLDLSTRLNDKHNTVKCEGTLGPMPLTALNPMVRELGTMQIKQGAIDRMYFTATMDNSRAYGKLVLLYHELDAEILDPESGKKGIKEKVMNFLARAKVPASNPSETGEAPRTGTIDYLRDPKKSVFSYLWKSVKTGLLSCLNMKGVAKKSKYEDIKEKGYTFKRK